MAKFAIKILEIGDTYWNYKLFLALVNYVLNF